MSTINISITTLEECAQIIQQETAEWHSDLISCHQKLAEIIDNGEWRGTTAENIAGEYYNMIIWDCLNPGRDNHNTYTLYLKDAAQTYHQAETTNNGQWTMDN
jgi:hypothetical protein